MHGKLDRFKRNFSNLLIRLKLNKLENIFIIIFIIFGFITIIMIPPGWNTDEPDHTYRIYQLSKGDLLAEPVVSPEGNDAFGGNISTNLVNFYTDAGVRDAGANALNTGQRVNDLYKNHPKLLTYNDTGSKTEINFSGSSLYPPTTYIVYLPVFIIGDALKASFFVIILLARICGLIVTGICFYFVIKKIAIGRWVIFALGLLPITVTQAATIGADAPAISLAILFIAVIINALYGNKPPSSKIYMVLTIIGVLLALVKVGYAPLILLVLVIPFFRKNWRTKRSIIYALLVVIISILPTIAWTHMVSYINTNSNLQANYPMQELFVLHHPLTYLKTLYYTYFTNQETPLAGLFGDAVWTSARLPDTYSYLAFLAIVLSIFVKSARDKSVDLLSKAEHRIVRYSLLIVGLITTVFISTILYVSSTTLDQSSISGIQARYFIPLFPVIFLAFYGNFVKNQITVKLIILSISILLLIGSLLLLYHRLYQMLPPVL